ncbi:hypothetical protein [Catenovulum adriaticum]|uniref:Uncharacterized protein n=1 Tax=Catenovulum adriaticum TaxID=2984846 RepID=A0ABY7ALS3_9ALTE|nr:hypothetical protein [Catenovulum sp. TS8]WAJ70503.1 hypothetical protein OLW01_01400 [Catenovulum sp. TS8]
MANKIAQVMKRDQAQIALLSIISSRDLVVQQKLEQDISSEDLATFNRVVKEMTNNLSSAAKILC